jgi:hypothetical protein
MLFVDPTMNVVAIMVYMFKYHPTYAKFKDKFSYKDGKFIFNEQ